MQHHFFSYFKKVFYFLGIGILSFSFQNISTNSLQAAVGDLDPTFGIGGIVTVDVPLTLSGTTATAGALQSDGKIGVGGFTVTSTAGTDFAVARYNSNGSLDTSFGSGGAVLTNFSGTNDEILFALAIQADGKIIAGGGSGTSPKDFNFALARYNSNGSLDSSFGNNGLVLTDFLGFGLADSIQALALQSDGKIIAAGTTVMNGSTLNEWAIARYNINGALDTSFGTAGKVVTHVSATSNDFMSGVVLQSDGKIVIAGYSSGDFVLARYNTNGSPDTSFGTNGLVVTVSAGSTEAVGSLALQEDGKIVIAGTSGNDFAVARYNSDGSLDTTFGSTGIVTTAFTDLLPSGISSANDLVIRADGKIVLLGNVIIPPVVIPFTNVQFALALYNSNGTLDPTFGTGGKLITSLLGGMSFNLASTLLLQPDGKWVATGSSGANSSVSDFSLARYLAESDTSNHSPVHTSTSNPPPLTLQGGGLFCGFNPDSSSPFSYFILWAMGFNLLGMWALRRMH